MNKTSKIIAVIALAACGGATPKATESRPGPALERQYPALAWVPADASYVVTGEVAQLARTLREAIQPLSILPGAEADVDRELRGLLGLNPLNEQELATAGVAIDRAAVMFSTGVWPTFAIPVEDAAALQAHIDEHWPRTGGRMRAHGDVELLTWNAAQGLQLSLARVGDWLLIGADAPESGSAPGAWLDAARAAFAGTGIAASEDLVGAARRARQRLGMSGADASPGVLGLLRVGQLLESLDAPRQAAQCLAAVGGAIRSVELSADVSSRRGAGVMAIELSPGAASALRPVGEVKPSAGYLGFRAAAGVYADLGVEPGWVLDSLEHALRQASCPVPRGLAAGSEVDSEPGRGDAHGRIGGGLIREMERMDVLNVHVAVHQLLPEERKVQAAVHVGLKSREPLERKVLDQIPGRSLIERKKTIGDQVVRVIDLGVFPRTGYQLTDDYGVVAIGSDAIEQVFGGTGPAADKDVSLLAAVGLRPERMTDMEATLPLVIEAVGLPQQAAPSIMRLLSRYADVGVSLTLVGSSIELRGWYELAP